MTFKLKTLTTSALLTALALTGQTVSAHPGFVNGGNPNGINWKNNTPTVSSSCTQNADNTWNCENMVMGTVRGYMVDAIRIGHGCDMNDDGAIEAPVEANSWLWPTGKGGTGNWGKAPMSTGCDATGKNCTGSATQPAVAKIPDSSQKANLNNAPNPAGMGAPTTLASELIEGDTTGAPGNPEVPISTLNPSGGSKGQPRFQFLGNLGYFKINVPRKPSDNYGGGFYAKGNKFDADQIAALGIGNVGAPYQNAFQALYAVDLTNDTAKGGIRKLAFSSASCARKLVVRPAGADLCKTHVSRSEYVKNPHAGNFWFGGPTNLFKTGHGINENFWMNYTLLVRDPAVNPYPATCTDKEHGDYDLVVMSSIAEIDNYLKFPGFATQP